MISEVPGLVFERIKAQFPTRNKIAGPIDEVERALTAEAFEEMQRSVPLVRFASNDGQYLVQIGQHLLGVNHLQPYTSWDAVLLRSLERLRHLVNRGGPGVGAIIPHW